MSEIKNREDLLKNETVRQQIAERAYFLSESENFAPGRETEFWLTAEEEVLAQVLPTNGTAAPARKATRKAVAKPVAAVEASEALVSEAPAKAAPRKRTVKKAAI